MSKMKNKKFCLIWTPIMAVALAAGIVATCVSNVYSGALDTYIGKGERTVTKIQGSESWNKTYYNNKYTTSTGENGSQVGAAVTAKKIADEGITLLKNQNAALPLAQKSSVAPFGYRYFNPFYGGSGSGSVVATDAYVVTPEAALNKNFTVKDTFANINGDTLVKKYYYDTTVENSAVLYFQGFTNSFNGSDQSIYEFEDNVYKTDSLSSNDTAIVFLGRSGGENNDVWSIPYNKKGDVKASAAGTEAGDVGNVQNPVVDNEMRHALELMPEEKATLELAKRTCGKVVVVINSSNAMELGSLADDAGIDAIVWIGGPGAKGFESLSDILCNKVNPSGHLVDTYVRDITADPTYKNIGDVDGYAYSNTKGLAPMLSKQYSGARKGMNPFEYMEYEEGVYLGYKYYETAFDTNLNGFTYGELNQDGSTKTAGQVVYPFGYGLSYTTFSQKITKFSGNEKTVSLTVEITNEGDVEGKDAVEVYLNAPYTDIDQQYGIEKPTAVLTAYGKSEMIPAHGSKTVKLTFDTDDFASYAYKHENGDGTKGCYMLDKGTYEVSVRSSSHQILDKKSFDIASTIWFDNTNPRQSEKDAQAKLDDDGNPTDIPAAQESDSQATFKAATNNFEDSNTYMDTETEKLTRATNDGLAVSNLVAGKKMKDAPEWLVNKLQHFDYATDKTLGNVEGSLIYRTEAPVSKQSNGKSVSDMRGLSYYSSEWDLLLNQIDYSSDQLKALMYYDQYTIQPLDSIGLGSSKSLDGPQGLTITTNFGATGLSTCAWPTEPVVAATFSPELGYEYGSELGQEALTIGCFGWYAPGLNIHRTAFSGRNFEYYSEDATLSGRMAARVISGASDEGLSCYMKHFALNDNDSNRANICVWANEQAMRENYLRSFEFAVKDSRATIKYISDAKGTVSSKVIRGATALMSSYNYVGATFAGANYGLLTSTLRGEWGFEGAVISDMTGGDEWRRDQMVRAGNDMCLWIKEIDALDTTSPTIQWKMRESVKHIAYMVANSSNMQGVAPGEVITYGISPWRIWVIILDVVLGAFVVGVGVWMVIRVTHHKDEEAKN